MGKSIWKTHFVFDAYELAKSGMLERKIAGVLGISHRTLLVWKEKKPVFGMAIKRGRKSYRGAIKGPTFRDYVFKRLSPDLKKLWNEISKIDKKKKISGVERIEALLSKRGVRVRQHLFVYAWTSSNFSISSALNKVNLNRTTFDMWKNNDPEFAAMIDEIHWHKKNFFEDHLCRLVAGGDTSATIHVNKTLNKDRGYGNPKRQIDLNVSGEIKHNIVNIDELGLPLDTRKEILEAIRRRNAITVAESSNN